MEQDRKTEIVEEHIAEVLKDFQREFSLGISFSMDSDYLNGKIVIRIDV